jgi:hypothetical protein
VWWFSSNLCNISLALFQQLLVMAASNNVDDNVIDQCLAAFEDANYAEAVRLLQLAEKSTKILWTFGRHTDHLGLLRLAVRNGWLDVVKSLMTNYIIELTKEVFDVILLFIAVKENHVDIVKYLIIEHGCDPMLADDDGRICLHHAVFILL